MSRPDMDAIRARLDEWRRWDGAEEAARLADDVPALLDYIEELERRPDADEAYTAGYHAGFYDGSCGDKLRHPDYEQWVEEVWDARESSPEKP